MAGQTFVFCTGILRSCKLDQFNLLKLVLTDHAADILAVRSSFGAETWSVGAEGRWKLRFVKNLVAENVCDGNLGGWNKPVIILLIYAWLVAAFVVAMK